MTKKVDYFESRNIAPEDYQTILACIPTRYVPSIVSAIETRKTRSFWETEDDFNRAYQVLTEVQMALLTDCSRDIVNNLIALRSTSLVAEPRDPLTGVPIADPQGSTLVSLWQTLDITRQGLFDIGDVQIARLDTLVAQGEQNLTDNVEVIDNFAALLLLL